MAYFSGMELVKDKRPNERPNLKGSLSLLNIRRESRPWLIGDKEREKYMQEDPDDSEVQTCLSGERR